MEDEKDVKEITEEIQEQAEPETAEAETTEETQESTRESGKTFTQAEVDQIVSDRLKRERRNQPAPERLKAFKEWEKSQQTEQEKAAEREKHYLDLEKENDNLKRENEIIKAGVHAEDVDYVLFKVSRMEGDFEENLKDFLKENAKYTAPETKTVEGASHKPKAKETITKKELQAMSYREQLEFKRKNPAAYEAAIRG